MAISKDMYKKDIVILGGGASALMCASMLEGRQVTIVEKADRVGKKILVTGNGRCNLTNTDIDIHKYNDSAISTYMDRFGSKDTIEYFGSIGLETYSDREGRVYPTSDSANSVLDVLRLKIDTKDNVDIMCGVDVKTIHRKDNKYILDTTSGSIECNTLVLAVGGLNGAQYLDDLHIPYSPYVRSLGALRSDKNTGLNGVKVDRVCITLDLGNKKYSQNGEILFKEDAISGIVVFNISAYFARENVDTAYVYIDFTPDKTEADLVSMLTIRKNTMKEYKMADYFTGLFHKAVGQSILGRVGIKSTINVKDISTKDIEHIAKAIKHYTVKVYSVATNNQVYSGGVALSELDDTLKVKNIPNLYCMGELIDVDAECGGYNLQWAWCSGYIVAKALSKSR